MNWLHVSVAWAKPDLLCSSVFHTKAMSREVLAVTERPLYTDLPRLVTDGIRIRASSLRRKLDLSVFKTVAHASWTSSSPKPIPNMFFSITFTFSLIFGEWLWLTFPREPFSASEEVLLEDLVRLWRVSDKSRSFPLPWSRKVEIQGTAGLHCYPKTGYQKYRHSCTHLFDQRYFQLLIHPRILVHELFSSALLQLFHQILLHLHQTPTEYQSASDC